jgi:hypothetical protein
MTCHLPEPSTTRWRTMSPAISAPPSQAPASQSKQTFKLTPRPGRDVLRRKPIGPVPGPCRRREFKVLHALLETDVPVPRVHALCTDDAVASRISARLEPSHGSRNHEMQRIVPSIHVRDCSLLGPERLTGHGAAAEAAASEHAAKSAGGEG